MKLHCNSLLHFIYNEFKNIKFENDNMESIVMQSVWTLVQAWAKNDLYDFF